jgi:S1-C subfamily serine protease
MRRRPLSTVALCLGLTILSLSTPPAHAAQTGWDAGEAAFKQGDWATAYRLLKPLADHGDGRAQTRIGDLLWAGYGVAQDRPLAIQWYRKAARQSVPLALARLGVFQINGTAMRRDVHGGIADLRRAAGLGSAYADEQLGLLFWQGVLVVRDPTRAVPMLRKAAIKGRPLSEHLLAEAYGEGQGVAGNLFTAAIWAIRAAADAGPAQRQTYGVARDRALARLPGGEAARARIIAADRKDSLAVTHTVTATPTAPTVPSTPHSDTLATGFFVTDGGLVLTDAHGTNDCATIRIIPSGAVVAADATIVASDPVNDLALLKTSLTGTQPVPFRKDRPIRAGDGVVVLGYPLPNVLSREVNVTVGNISAMAGERGDTRYLQMTAPIQIGNSGGPLLDMSGDVIGVVARKLNAMEVQKLYGDMPENVNFATRARYARQFLTDNGIRYRTAPSTPTRSAADIADAMRKSIVLVECRR